ncbi:calcium-translocating P-type ATPase, PMCA-type [Methanobrevibacter sp. OttesenSCG-928-K11]|nr:calcium-translocating P-type ATPase, PMCA-type [Methanobrevibacter sp. OttesenSCG-928-K11]MDL2270178.1 calcium-translocating P-type ATPase, PMCA-type [Methanobrevibacter sp. OttesenSCG-928-I08]
MSEILSKYNTSLEGLSTIEVEKRREEYGDNELKEEKKKSPIVLFLMQFVDILIILLIIAAIAAYFVGDLIDAIVILIVVTINAVVGFVQEYRAEKAMEKLKSLVSTEAVVKRNGELVKVPGNELTVGDIVAIEEGDKIPADLLLIEVNELRVDESALTGESRPVSKNIDYENVGLNDVNKSNPPEELKSKIAYMDSAVVSGRGVGVVVAIGMETSIGKIAEMIQGEDTETPLQIKVNSLGKTLGLIAVIVCVAVFILEFQRGVPLVETFMTAVSLAVAAVPEGLPAVLTLTLALGMQQMAKSNAIVRKLLAVETLGSCSVVCTDKTGTLTKNKMTVREDELINKEKALTVCGLCTNSSIKDGKEIGDPTDVAIMVFGENNGYIKSDLEKKYPRIKEIPLDSTRKRMTTIHQNESELLCITKGAPEILLDMCKYVDNEGNIQVIDDAIKKNIENKIKSMTNSALRVIGLAYKNMDPTDNIDDLNPEDIEKDLTFVGMVGMIDPPRQEAKIAVEDCKKAGIKVIMITGDHQETAAAIGREIGILTNGKVITGEELESLTEEEYLKIVDDIQIYARVYPEQKMRIVQTLQDQGNIVSMTGDGVNDAPALKKASIGVAMGSGTDVAKESSDMVIQDDNFATIIKAIAEGRKIFDNIKRFVKFQVSTNVGAILTIVGASLISLPIPFNPIQILWINIIMDGPPAQSLGMEGPEDNLMTRKPENGDILNKNILTKIVVAGIVMAVGTLAVFVYKLNTANEIEAMSVAFTLFVVYQLFNAYNNRSQSKVKNKFFSISIAASFILQLFVLYIPYLQGIFRTTGIGIYDWILIFVVALTILVSERIMNKLLPQNT